MNIENRLSFKWARNLLIGLSISFIIFSTFLNTSYRMIIDESIIDEMEKDTSIISKEVKIFFAKYIETVNTMGRDETLLSYVRGVRTKEDKVGHPLYEAALIEMSEPVIHNDEVKLTWVGINAINEFQNHDPELKFNPENYRYDQRPWYKTLIEADGDVSLSPIYHAHRDNDLVVSIMVPVMEENQEEADVTENIGQIVLDLSILRLKENIETYEIGNDGFAVLFDNNGKIICPAEEQEQVREFIYDNGQHQELLSVEMATSLEVKYRDTPYYFSIAPVGQGNWYVGSFRPASEFSEQITYINLFLIMIAIAIGIIILSLYNLSNLHKNETYIKNLANIDPLTEIPNRRSYMQKIQQEIREGSSGAVMMLDLDNFKEINDIQGHVFGDNILRDIAQFLMIQIGDRAFVSRFGGDEFLILLNGVSSKERIIEFADGIVEAFDHHFRAQNDVFITFSMGIATYPYHSMDINELISFADTSMYHVKKAGKNNYVFYDDTMIGRVQSKMEIEKVLREALTNEGFKLVYQPQIDVKTECLVGAEALIRLEDNAYSPGTFIPIAEESGLIIEIGRWVIEEAIGFISKNPSDLGDIPVSINVSPKQIKDAELLEFIDEKLEAYDVKPSQIHLEVTENVIFENEERSMLYQAELKKRGIKTALDDFGTGFSSISYLAYLQMDYLKLDKAICDRFLNETSKDTIRNIIGLGHSLNIAVIAEGIEYKEQVHALREMGCDIIQGYYYSRPLSEDGYLSFLKENTL